MSAMHYSSSSSREMVGTPLALNNRNARWLLVAVLCMARLRRTHGLDITCSDGSPAFVECTDTCTADPTLNCEQINGQGYCCAYVTTASNSDSTNSADDGCRNVVEKKCDEKAKIICFEPSYRNLAKTFCNYTCFCGPNAVAKQSTS